MLNPWISFGFKTVRQAWETQSAVTLSLMRMFGGGAFDQTEDHLTKEKGIAVTAVETAATPVEKKHGIVGRATPEITERSTIHKRPAL